MGGKWGKKPFHIHSFLNEKKAKRGVHKMIKIFFSIERWSLKCKMRERERKEEKMGSLFIVMLLFWQKLLLFFEKKKRIQAL